MDGRWVIDTGRSVIYVPNMPGLTITEAFKGKPYLVE
jgi:hypothetical protein